MKNLFFHLKLLKAVVPAFVFLTQIGMAQTTDNNSKLGPSKSSISWNLNGNASGGATLGPSDGSDLPIITGSGQEKMRIRANGDLWIMGQTSVRGGDMNHGFGYFDGVTGFAGKRIDGPVLYGWSGGALGINQTQYNTRKIALRWDINGNVHVGATIPTAAPYSNAKFTVDGTAVVQEIYVTTTAAAWADHVFQKGYKLAPLQEVERFISNNQRLPNIPSASEIEGGGQNLGKLQALQMQKIEELTLYVIALNKKVEALQKENEELKKAELKSAKH